LSILKNFNRAVLFRLDPEIAHELSLRALASGLVPGGPVEADSRLQTTIAGLEFPNPLGLAAGYDKNAQVPDAILRLGFGFTEIGTVTPRPQTGNPKPRIFRLTEFDGVINRLGFNNEGHDIVLERLRKRAGRPGIIGVNIGANKDSPDFIADYESGIEKFWNVASYFAVNISSPNTPGLRDLQMAEALERLLERISTKCIAKTQKTGLKRPILLKLAPDLDTDALMAITEVIRHARLDGLIVSNTTLSRHGVESSPYSAQDGGLSGRPLFERSTIILARIREQLGPDMPIIGVGGIDSAQTAFEKMQAGANLVQCYTGMIFRGPCLPAEIVRGLIERMNTEGVSHIGKIVGCRSAEWAARKLPGENE
jgi:dihydroorotate dehydrogenase